MKSGIQAAVALIGVAALTGLGVAALVHVERPPIEGVQRGFRGTAMDQIYNPRTLTELASLNQIPRSLPPASSEGVKAGVAYKNVKVLSGLSVGQFTRLMVSITQWVAPKQGCAYCHNVANMADDGLYTKVVARRMLQMTQHINADWKSHVLEVGVTCYTCHRGNPVPKQIWFNDPGPPIAGGMASTAIGKNHPAGSVNDSSLPYDPFTPFLEQAHSIRVQATTALPVDDMHTIKETDWTYALMIHFSQSLGVNCTYCHNSRSFADWSQSSPARVNAWYGIRMVRDANNNYLDGLNNVFPAYRKGPAGDSPKVNCATCHQGIYKPLYGVSMLTTFPELAGPTLASVTPPPALPQSTPSDTNPGEPSPAAPPTAAPPAPGAP